MKYSSWADCFIKQLNIRNMITVILIIVASIVVSFGYNMYTVTKANQWFYNELIELGYDHTIAKMTMDAENVLYQRQVSNGRKGYMLRQHLEFALKKYQ